MKHPWRFALLCACATDTVGAANLLEIYDRALIADPLWQQATTTQLAIREDKTQALINLLPINLSANKNWAGAGSTTLNTPAYAALDLSVNLFSWESWIALKSADATVAQGEANYQAAAQSLIQRAAQQYFAVLAAQDMLGAQQRALQSVQTQLDQAEKNFQGGLISRTDLEATSASHDSTAAAVITAKRVLSTQQNLLRAITNETYLSLAAPGDNMPLLTPDPTSEDAWVTTAMNQNSSLIASRMSAEIARDNMLSAYGGHVPRINVSVSRNWALQHVDPNDPVTTTIAGVPGFAIPVNTNDVVWAVGITVPIFTGGATQSKVRQARYYWDAAKSGVDFTTRQTEEQTRDAFEGVVSQISQVKALRRAVETNRVSLQAALAAYDVGTKTVVDVITSRDALTQADLNYAQAKYAYLNDIVMLRFAAGTLDRSVVEMINGWLVEPE